MASSSNDARRVDVPHTKIIKLNVGGVKFITSLATLHMYPDSYLGHLFSGKYETHLNEEEEYFIDANGDMFVYILNFLRRGKLTLPDDFHDFALLDAEADFFQIMPLIDQLQKLKDYQNKQKQSEILAVFSAYWNIREGEEDWSQGSIDVLLCSYFKSPSGSFELIENMSGGFYTGRFGHSFYDGSYDVTKCFSDEGYTSSKKYERLFPHEVSGYLRAYGVKVLPDLQKVEDPELLTDPDVIRVQYTVELWTKLDSILL